MSYQKSVSVKVNRTVIGLAVLVIAVCLLVGAETSHSDNRAGQLKTFVSIPPLAYLVEQVGGSNVQVEVLLPAGQSPETYEPTPRQMVHVSESDLFVAVGVPFERKMLDVFASTFRDLSLLDLSKDFDVTGQHGEHSPSEDLDPHIWMSPRLAARAAGLIRDRLIELAPDQAGIFRDNFASLQQKLDSVDSLIRKTLAPYAGMRFYVYHPAFGHFAEEYGLVQVAIESGAHEPSPQYLASVLQQAKADGITTLFVQPQFSSSEVKAIADELGASIGELDPMARDYTDNLVRIADRVAAALSETPPGENQTDTGK